MKIKLLPKVIIEGIPSEDRMSDCLKLEIMYEIRKLKALEKSIEDGWIEVTEDISGNQRFSKQFQIWFQEDEFEIIPDDESPIVPVYNENGITIKQLKIVVRDLPEKDKNGLDYELWCHHKDNEGLSSIAIEIGQLNKGDLIITMKN